MTDHGKSVILDLNNVKLSYHSGRKAFDRGIHHVLDGGITPDL